MTNRVLAYTEPVPRDMLAVVATSYLSLAIEQAAKDHNHAVETNAPNAPAIANYLDAARDAAKARGLRVEALIEHAKSTIRRADDVPVSSGRPTPRRFDISATTQRDLENRFSYHSPKDEQPVHYELLRFEALQLAKTIVERTPPSREQSIALTKLEEVCFFANAAIARNE
jgi:hypothetical protein